MTQALADSQNAERLSQHIMKDNDRAPVLSDYRKHSIADYGNMHLNDSFVRQQNAIRDEAEFDELLYEVEYYDDDEISDARIDTYDYDEHYRQNLAHSKGLIESSHLAEAEHHMGWWEESKNEMIVKQMEQKGVPQEASERILKDWESPARKSILALGADLYGREVYDTRHQAEHFLATQYFDTQEYLSHQQGNSIRAYTSSPQSVGEDIGVITLDPAVARAQSPTGDIYQTDIPKPHVVSLAHIGMGSTVRHEATVINTEQDNWRQSRVT